MSKQNISQSESPENSNIEVERTERLIEIHEQMLNSKAEGEQPDVSWKLKKLRQKLNKLRT